MMGPIPEFPVGYRLPTEAELEIRRNAALRADAIPEATLRPAPRVHRFSWRRRPVMSPGMTPEVG
jgi:hypothetical protein